MYVDGIVCVCMIRRNFSSQSSIAVITGRKGSNHDFTEILFTSCSNTDITCHKASNFGQICDSHTNFEQDSFAEMPTMRGQAPSDIRDLITSYLWKFATT